MRLIRILRADGTSAFVNPLLVRAVIANDKRTSMIQFDNDHVIMARDTAEVVAREVEAALRGDPPVVANGNTGSVGQS